MARRVLALTAVAAAVVALVYTATSGSSRPSAGAPESLVRPFLVRAGGADEDVQLSPDDLEWRSPVHGVPFHLRFSWLQCDLKGAHCSQLAGLRRQTIAPPQEARIVTLRGVVTGTNRYGSRSAVSRNFYYDMAGLVFDDARFPRAHLQYGPDQLRAWYGLAAGQNGAGQTIVIPDFGRVRALRAAVSYFSRHYGLPGPCGTTKTRGCFELVVSHAGKKPTRLLAGGNAEAAADVEWTHAIAPRAKIVFLQFDYAAPLFDKVGRLGRSGRASVVSDSWCDPCSRHDDYVSRTYGRLVVFPHLAGGCHLPHLVCVQASGDQPVPGEPPANSPFVLAVGGTEFKPRPDGATGQEIPWPSGGSGVTDIPLPRPSWQKHLHADCGLAKGDFSCTKRAVPDVSATAAAVPVVESTYAGPEWVYFSGTSLSTPLWAALIALTDQELQQSGQRPVGIDELHRVLYRGDVSGGLDDLPPHGWDWTTGLGSPKSGIVPALARAIERYRG